ncbi:MAG: hypothetical protein K2N09_00280 [Muribaculaceae bacterium]|nr:hypothetical protein [Muribaculaceae bacterium]
MKKKLLYGFTLALLGSVSMGTLQSCKDDWSDLNHKVDFNQKDLLAQLTKLEGELRPMIVANKVSIDSLGQVVKNYANKDSIDIAGLRADLDALTAGMTETSIMEQIESLIKSGAVASGKDFEDAINAINARLDLLPDNLSNRLTKLESYSNALDSIIPGYNSLSQTVNTIKEQYQAQQEALGAMQGSVKELWESVYGEGGLSAQMSQYYYALQQDIEDKYNELAASNKDLWESIYAPGGLSDQMSQYFNANKDAIDDLSQDQKDLWESIYAPGGLSDQMSQYYNDNKDAIAANAADTKELWESVFGEGGVMTLVNQYYRANQEEIEELRASNTELWESIYGDGGLTTQISQYYTANKNAIEELAQDMNDQLDRIINRVDNLITSILLQGVYSPVFGSFNLPFDVQSNILFNWCGYNDLETYNFPNAGSEYNYKDEAPALTFVDLAALSPKVVELKKGYFGDLNLGKVYMTLNPAGHYFDENAFKLETSSEKKFPATLKVSKSNDELFFGYTRATVKGNGFYAADVVVSEEDIPSVEIVIDPGLKSAVNKALRDPSKFSPMDFVKGLYNQFRNFPAYAVRYDWTVNDQPYSVIGKYDIMATTAKPFSYQMLVDGSFGAKLPIYNHIENIIYKLKDNENLKFDFTKYGLSFDDGKYTINIPPLVIDDKSITVSGGDLYVHIPAMEVLDANGNVVGKTDAQSIQVQGNDLKNLYSSIEKGIKDAINSMTSDISGWSEDLSDEVNSKVNDMLADVQSKLNNALKEIGDDITGRIENILDDLGEQAQPYFDRLNKLIDLYNKVAGKINRFLQNPNHYLQVAMFYTQNDSNLGLVSNSLNSPTMFNKGNNNGWIGLYASSYTAEILAPAYMKYVAITNVYDAKTKKPVSVDLKALNAKGKFLNQVVDGKTLRFGISASSLEPNKIYEIVYQGVDYQARTSTQKFYIQVK